MAPPKTKKPQNHPDGEQCEECGAIIARRGDMPRHKRIHADEADKNTMLHRCPWEGCNYSSLQRPNVDTHYRTHTKERNQACPDCDSKFSDPGSLIRHRKNLHGYVPKPRKKRITTAAPEQSSSTRGTRRHQPYSRSPSVSSSSNASSPEPTAPTTSTSSKTATDATVTTTPSNPGADATTSAFPVIFSPDYSYTAMQSIPLSKPRLSPCPYGYPGKDDLNIRIDPNLTDTRPIKQSFFWRYQDHDPECITRTPSPKILFPARETGKHMEPQTVHYVGWEGEGPHCMTQGDANSVEEWKRQLMSPSQVPGGEEEGAGFWSDLLQGQIKYEDDQLLWGDVYPMDPPPPVAVDPIFSIPDHNPYPAFDADPGFVYSHLLPQSVQPVRPPSSTSLLSHNIDWNSFPPAPGNMPYTPFHSACMYGLREEIPDPTLDLGGLDLDFGFAQGPGGLSAPALDVGVIELGFGLAEVDGVWSSA